MSNILALDASLDACSVALSCDGEVWEVLSDIPRQHSQRLLPMVNDLLTSRNLSLKEVDAIAYGQGPGSFTGIRICLSIVQGLAFGAGIPVVGVSTLAALACRAAHHHTKGDDFACLTALDARMGQLYWALYLFPDGSHTYSPQVLIKDSLNNPEDIVSHSIMAQQLPPLTGVGSGCQNSVLNQSINFTHCCPDDQVRASDIVRMAEQKLKNAEGVSAIEAQPVYLRDEINWKKRERQRKLPHA